MRGNITELKNIFSQIATVTAKINNKDILANSVCRAVNRESDAAFNMIERFYNTEDTAIVNASDHSKTKILLIKPVGDHCNLRCTYCYELQRLHGSHEKVMSIAQIKSYLKNFVGENSDVTDIFLHGGEPLLAGKKFFRSFLDTLDELGLLGKVTIGVQTNGTLLDEEWVDLLLENEFNIGVSLDGDETINDEHRIDHKGRGTYKRVLRGIRLLQKRNALFGIICVVSSEFARKEGTAKRILNHFVSLGAKFIDIHPAFTPVETSGSAANCNLSPVEYTDFMTELTRAWIECANPDLRLRCMEDLLQNLSDVKSPTCYASGCCTSILGIDPSGAVSPCTRPFHTQYIFGNAGESTLAELEKSKSFEKFVSDEKRGRDRTHSCQWSELCGYGNCPHERFTNGSQDPAGRHIFCACEDDKNADTGFPGFYQNFAIILKEYLEHIQTPEETFS